MSDARLKLKKATPTLLDYSHVEQHISARTSEALTRDRAFISYALEKVFGVPPADQSRYVVDGPGDRGVDAIYVDHELARICVCSFKVVGNFNHSKRNFPGTEVDKLISFFEDLLNDEGERFVSARLDLKLLVSEVRAILESERYSLELHLFSNQLPLVDHEHQRLSIFLFERNIKLFENHLYELSHGVVRASKPKFNKKLKPQGSVCEYTSSGVRSFLFALPLTELHRFLSDEKGFFDERLLDANVRYYLGAENEVNREISNTILDGRSAEFALLNNGITIVSEQVSRVPGSNFGIHMRNPQIVNGGQTSQALFSTASLNKSLIGGGFINVRIVETADATLTAKIAKASNTQSRIFGRDLRADDPVQLKIASGVGVHEYHYQRKRGESVLLPSDRVIDSHRIGQLMYAYVLGEPVKAKTMSQDIFGELYAQVFDAATVTVELIITIHRLSLALDSLRNEQIVSARKSSGSVREPWIVEGYFHTFYALGEVVRRLGISLSDFNGAREHLGPAIDLVGEVVTQHPNIAMYRLFRSVNSKVQLTRAIDRWLLNPSTGHRPTLPLQANLFGEDF